VTAVVCAAFDPGTDAAILAVRERLRALGHRLPDQPRHRPHFTLAAAGVDPGAELERLAAVVEEVAARHQPVPVTLSEVGRFGRAGALWLGPGTAPALADLHRDVVRALATAGWASAFGERSDPGQWVPHCTLATRVPTPRLRELHAALSDGYRPIAGTIDALATILVGGRGDAAHAPLTAPG
jgi:2'-5' RNA ligase